MDVLNGKNKSFNVSVVVSTYQREQKLDKCLQAIFKNNYIFEIIVVHDGPSNIYEKFSSNFKILFPDISHKIKFYNTDIWYGFPGPARNFGFKISQSNIVAFCDDDDLWSENHIDECKYHLENRKDIDIIFTNPSDVNSKKKVYLYHLFYKNFLWQSACVVRKNSNILFHFNYSEDKRFKAIEDIMLWENLIFNGAYISYVNSNSIIYFKSLDSIRSNILVTHYRYFIAHLIQFGANGLFFSIIVIFFRIIRIPIEAYKYIKFKINE